MPITKGLFHNTCCSTKKSNIQAFMKLVFANYSEEKVICALIVKEIVETQQTDPVLQNLPRLTNILHI